jgi:predicted hydrocarbon binding protein
MFKQGNDVGKRANRFGRNGFDMLEGYDFEGAWLKKLSDGLDLYAGEEIRLAVMEGSENLSSQSSSQDVIRWSKSAMERLDSLVANERRVAIMTGCACRYPKAALQPMREMYATTRDLEGVHHMLQEQFESFLRSTLDLSKEYVEEIIRRGWGTAGILEGCSITAIKIPKSGNLVEYLREPNQEKRREVYCHCPRVRAILKSGETLSPTYCYCGAGYYKGMWEEILQMPVSVELLQSVLGGDDVCSVVVHLPTEG